MGVFCRLRPPTRQPATLISVAFAAATHRLWPTCCADCAARLTQGMLLVLLWVCLSALAVGLMLVARAGPRVATSLLLLLTFAQGMAFAATSARDLASMLSRDLVLMLPVHCGGAQWCAPHSHPIGCSRRTGCFPMWSMPSLRCSTRRHLCSYCSALAGATSVFSRW